MAEDVSATLKAPSADSHVMTSYQRLPVAFERGEGAWLFDRDGQRYLDALSGIAVCGLGHAHPDVTCAIVEQANRLLHTSNLYQITSQELLAERLTTLMGMDKVFFANSGAEANEAAIKIARLYGHRRGIDTPIIITTEGGFHGRTLATLSATGNAKIQRGFGPLVPGFLHLPYNDNAILCQQSNANIVAVMLEPIQGENGVIVPEPGYLRAVADLCEQNEWLFILDEVQTGMGRTGAWFAFQHESLTPDLVTVAKALGNGMPIGACVASGKAADLIQPGDHGSTFGGNPLAARAGLAVIETLQRDNRCAYVARLGDEMLAAFKRELGEVPGVVAIRGKGLMMGIELDRECGVLVRRALDEHLLINVVAGCVIRLLPPLIIDECQARQIVDRVAHLVRTFLAESAL